MGNTALGLARPNPACTRHRRSGAPPRLPETCAPPPLRPTSIVRAGPAPAGLPTVLVLTRPVNSGAARATGSCADCSRPRCVTRSSEAAGPSRHWRFHMSMRPWCARSTGVTVASQRSRLDKPIDRGRGEACLARLARSLPCATNRPLSGAEWRVAPSGCRRGRSLDHGDAL